MDMVRQGDGLGAALQQVKREGGDCGLSEGKAMRCDAI